MNYDSAVRKAMQEGATHFSDPESAEPIGTVYFFRLGGWDEYQYSAYIPDRDVLTGWYQWGARLPEDAGELERD